MMLDPPPPSILTMACALGFIGVIMPCTLFNPGLHLGPSTAGGRLLVMSPWCPVPSVCLCRSGVTRRQPQSLLWVRALHAFSASGLSPMMMRRVLAQASRRVSRGLCLRTRTRLGKWPVVRYHRHGFVTALLQYTLLVWSWACGTTWLQGVVLARCWT